MKDRVVQYPHRYQLVPVSGQSDTYDIIAKPGTVTEVGTPLNKATLLKDTTAALVGLGTSALPDEALRAAALKTKGRLIQSYTVAGTYTWTAPNLNDGADYEVGVLIIGGGGSGAANKRWEANASGVHASGGASGYMKFITKVVTPFSTYNIVVGTGGAAVSTTTGSISGINGNSGATSSFDGNTALGGGGGNYGASAESAKGGIGSDSSSALNVNTTLFSVFFEPPYGGRPPICLPGAAGSVNAHAVYPFMCSNPITGKLILGAGGTAIGRGYDDTYTFYQTATIIFEDGGKAGSAKSTWNVSGDQAAYDATSCGCGGGAIVFTGDIANTSDKATSGAGADGGVFIYV